MPKTARHKWQNRTITVDFQDETTYFQLLDDGKAFIEESMEMLGQRTNLR